MKDIEYKGKKYQGVIIPEFDPADFVAGANSPIKLEPRNTTKNWLQFFSEAVRQTMVWGDTMGCVSFTALHHLVTTQFNWMLANNLWPKASVEYFVANRFIIDGKFNLSERFIVALSGTNLVGNSAQNVLQAIRKVGVVPEWICPNDGPTTRAEYFTISGEAQAMGLESLKYFTAFWQAIPESLANDYLVQAPIMIFTPVCPGWGSDQVVKTCDLPVQHATAIYDIDERTGVFEIYDQYAPFQKALARNYPIPYLFQVVIYPTPQGIDAKPFNFEQDINVSKKVPGEASTQVLELQKRLALPRTGIYDENTRAAVLNFQLRNLLKDGVASIWELLTLQGRSVGPKTRKALNQGMGNVVSSDMDQIIKPGYQTTEFWLSAIAQVVGLVAALGYITPDQSATLTSAVTQIVGGVVAVATFIQYMRSRTALKTAAIGAMRAGAAKVKQV